jgi:U3 small nucleolar RNA-associated protein 20
LSWLLKYLARPLVANLPSTFNQIAPLLGKTRQKQYVRRFASEAFAFLLRRIKEPTEIVKVMLSDIDQNEEFSEAITNVFVESMKAPGNSLHSKALSLFNALSENSRLTHLWALLMLDTESSQSITRGVLEQVVYNTSKDNVSPLLDNIRKMLNGNTRELAIDLLQSCCTVKGGSKVTDWSKLKSPLVDLIDANNLDSKQLWLLAARVVSKSDTITSKTLTQKIFEKLRPESVVSKSDSTTSETLTQRISGFPNENIGRRIYVFCQLVGKLNKSYFQKWVLEEFVK